MTPIHSMPNTMRALRVLLGLGLSVLWLTGLAVAQGRTSTDGASQSVAGVYNTPDRIATVQRAAQPCVAAAKGDVSFVLRWTHQGDAQPLGPDIDIWVIDPKNNNLNSSSSSGMEPTSDGGKVDRDDRGGYASGGGVAIGGGPERVFWPEGRAPAGVYKYGCRHFKGTGTATCMIDVFLKMQKISTVTDAVSPEKLSRTFEFDGSGRVVKQPADVTATTLQAAARQVALGAVVDVPVWLVKAANVGSMNFSVKYDPSVVKLESLPVPGNLLRNATPSVNPDTPGVVQFGFVDNAGVTGTDTVLTLPFRAVGAAGARSPVTLGITYAAVPGNQPVRVEHIDGLVEILGPGGVPSSDCIDTPTPPGEPVVLPPNPPVVTPTPPIPPLPGDCDGDGVLKAVDALCALHMSTGRIKPMRLIMDLDSDGRVTAGDAGLILKKVVGR